MDFLHPNTRDTLMLFGADMCNLGFYDWSREFWWIVPRHDDQQEIVFTRLRMLITWRCASHQVKNIPATSCFDIGSMR